MVEGGVPVEGAEGEGQAQPGAMGFAAGLMMKAHSLKEGVKEKSSGINLGNVQVWCPAKIYENIHQKYLSIAQVHVPLSKLPMMYK